MSQDLFSKYRLSRLINASGTETVYGASPVGPEVSAAMAAILPHWVDMAELQAAASRVIARATGAEAGCITGCTSASLAIAAAACMTGLDFGRIEQLPDTQGMRRELVIQKGHVVHYGASITGDLRLTGARTVEFGAAAESGVYQLQAALTENTAAAIYVVSHHCVQTGMIELGRYCEVSHAAGVPVIVDAAAEYDWPGILRAGADLVLVSAQKALGGPTAGIIAGRRDLVRACHAQQRGIGRPMKAGKEAVIGTMAALERWITLDHNAVENAIEARVAIAVKKLSTLPGLQVSAMRDDTGNPFSRVILTIDPRQTGQTAYGLAQALAAGKPRILLRGLYADRATLQMDVRRLDDAMLELVCGRIHTVLTTRPERLAEMPAPADRSLAAVRDWLGGDDSSSN
jgi:uncharacterized pyridoxal phosphate-dependent enzyme